MFDADSSRAYRSLGSMASEEERDLDELKRIIGLVQREDSRRVLQTYVDEPQANGVKIRMLKPEAKNLRNLCKHVSGPSGRFMSGGSNRSAGPAHRPNHAIQEQQGAFRPSK
ncbi:MAG: hypothetical protein QOI63_1007 [Thermoplasmata archaeon]|nr:hypothetical protein [Thermoplasmata archaeon]